jgi:Arc/MetJ family transcription regulator
MRTTIPVDDDLIAKVQAYTELDEKRRLCAKRSRP